MAGLMELPTLTGFLALVVTKATPAILWLVWDFQCKRFAMQVLGRVSTASFPSTGAVLHLAQAQVS